ncbi:MAG: hypothetical protein QXZ68_04745 [Candidatus Bathyarchaeia archaeon]
MSEEVSRMALVIEKHKQRLLSLANVTGVGIGYKKVKGVKTDILSIVVFVRKKLPLNQLAPKDIVPPTVEGVPTDVVEAEFVTMQLPPRTSKIRPAIGGISVGHYLITAGTITDILTDYLSKQKVVASNNHVLANCAPYGRAEKGDRIYQPGPYDGGTVNDTIATLERWKPLGSRNVVDGAIGMPLNQNDVSPNHYDFGVVSGPYFTPAIGIHVQKGGRTTGLTEGIVSVINATVAVGGYGMGGTLYFDHQIIIESETVFIQGGDSGSLLVEKNSKRPCGVCFAGTSDGRLAVANDFSKFSDALKAGYLPLIYGKIVHEGKPVEGAFVKVDELNAMTTTDSEGNFMIGNLGFGQKYTLTVYHPNYEQLTKTFFADVDYINVGSLELKPLRPRTDVTLGLMDFVSSSLAIVVFGYVVAPTIISHVKSSLEEALEVIK